MSTLPNLFSPIKIGRITVKNRLVMPAMSVNFGVDENGFVNDQLTEYFVSRAKGGTGMLIVGGGGIDPIGHELPELPALWDSKCVIPLSRMTRKVKGFKVKFGMQIMHGGRQTPNPQKEAPSPIAAPAVVEGIPKELSINRIRELVYAFGDSAKYCKDAGFDFVEIHAAHGYLINQFMSPNANCRTDKYGGSYENRIRFLLEILQNIKTKTQYDFPIGIRLNGEDYIDNGWGLDDSAKLASILEEEGADYLHISAGVYGSTQLTVPSMYVKQGCFMHLANTIKKRVSIPVIAVGRIIDPEFADQQIYKGNADMISMGRSHLADPNIAIKARTNNLSYIRPCIGCCIGCIERVLSLESASCVVNPEVGREYQVKSKNKVSIPKKLLVIGSGVSGLTAAREAAFRGHKVVILDKSSFIGGTSRIAAIPPGRSNIADILSFLLEELNRLGVEIRINVKINERIINKIMPNEVIIATGALVDFPIIKGLSKTTIDLCTPIDVLTRNTIVGYKSVVLGGNQMGLVTADYLSEKGKKVTVLHRGRHFAEDMASNDRFYLRERLKKKQVKLYKHVKINKIFNKKLTFNHKNKVQELTEVDTIVISEKVVPIRELKDLFKNTGIKIHIIGDANKPGNIIQSITDGWQIGTLI